MNALLSIGSMVILGAVFAGCNKAETTAEVQSDVAEAQATRSENVAEARRDGADEISQQQQDLNAQRRDVNEAAADRNYDVAIAKAEGDHKVATEACEALAGSAQTNCKDQADAMLKSEKSRAETLKPRV